MKYLVLIILLSTSVVNTQEIHTLTAPITKPNQLTIRIERVTIDFFTRAVTIQWLGNNGEAGSAVYPTPSPNAQPSGATLITQLNKMNFSAGNPSFFARVNARLVMDGYIPAGTLSGTPD